MSTNNMTGDRLPPHTDDGERGVLGCALLSPFEVVNAAKEMGAVAGWFYDLRHQRVWSVIESLDNEQKPVDLISVCQRLKDVGQLDEVGGVAFVAGLSDGVTSAANAGYYLELVKGKWQVRRMLSALSQAQARLWEFTGSVPELLAELSDEVLSAASAGVVKGERALKAIMPEVIDDMEKFFRGKTKLRGLSTGFGYWDKVLQGIRSDSYMVIAARPGDGKTAMALNLVRYLATEYVWWEDGGRKTEDGGRKAEDGEPILEKRVGIPVGVFSLEMSDKSLGERLLFCDSQVSSGKWNQGYATNDAMPKFIRSVAKLSNAPVWVDESESLTISEIRSRARRMLKEHGIKIFFLDYMQLVRGDPGRRYRDDVERLNDISDGLRRLVKELKVPFVVLAQMNRDIEKAETNRVPVLGDLKGCGQIEQDAAQVCFLFRPSSKMLVEMVKSEHGLMEESNALSMIEDTMLKQVPRSDKTQWPVRIDVWVAKNRGGPTGRVGMLFQRDFVRFEDWHEWCVEHGWKDRPEGERGPEDGGRRTEDGEQEREELL